MFLLAALATMPSFACQKEMQPDQKNNLFEMAVSISSPITAEV